MDNNFSKGARYAIKEVYANIHGIKQKTEEIKNTQGEEASKEFLEGYYKGLTFFTHAFDYVSCSDETINEKIKKYEQDYGKAAGEAFLMGIDYYKNLENEKESTLKR